mgnify:CR=1 FL=1
MDKSNSTSQHQLIGERFMAPTSNADFVEGVITLFDNDSGKVVLTTDDGDRWKGYEYQLESLI